MNTVTKEVFLLKEIEYGYETVSLHNHAERAGSDYILLGIGEVTFKPVDDKDQRVAAADQLKRKKQKMIADHVVAVEKIDDRIQQLLAIGFDGREQ